MLNIYFLIYLLAVFVASFSQILLKKAAMNQYPNRIREYLNVFVILGYGMMFVSMFLAIVAYKGIEYKNGMIIDSLGNVLVLIFSYLFFKEKIGPRKIIGILLILCGFFVFYI